MDGVLWYVLASSRGGPTRVRILRAIEERPRNANQLATELDLDYTTIRHHLDVLMDNNVLRRSGEEYAAVYLFTDQVRSNWDVVEEILRTVDPDGEATGGRSDDEEGTAPGGGRGEGAEIVEESGAEGGAEEAERDAGAEREAESGDDAGEEENGEDRT